MTLYATQKFLYDLNALGNAVTQACHPGRHCHPGLDPGSIGIGANKYGCRVKPGMTGTE